MDHIPLWAQICAVFVLLLCSSFFSISETAMMALNRHRLKLLAGQNALGAKTTQRLLSRTDTLLSVILIGNNLFNTIIPVLTTSIALRTFGHDNLVLSIATGIVAFLIIVFAEITPKIVGATYPERIALPASLVIAPLMRVMKPVIWFVNQLANGILRMLRINTQGDRDQRFSPEELRSIVLESGSFMPTKHRSILLNLFDLENITVDDVMIPRRQIESLNFDAPLDDILHQLETCYHNRLIVYQGDIDQVLGVLHVRKTLTALHNQELDRDTLRGLLAEPYYVPSGTPVFQQLQYFQESRQRTALVVNEYGELEGLLTPEDIIEELIGEFTTSTPNGGSSRGGWNASGECIVAGSIPLRELNRWLHLSLPTKGPKTLNGLILEILEEIPDGDVCMKIGDVMLEVMRSDDQAVRTVKLFKPRTTRGARALLR
ncbi:MULTISPECIES: HlyC/CorC family transporter [Burkholderia]|uniref:HlyC/CorC family transporter n=3 Tax=Burkholderia gladioli TaxID=28095 RepID=A0A0M2QFW5_BURGA|nr:MULTISPECIES: HlyC/CorC family transporter [Burkholderia]NBI47253.1 HlyC/CorC family transporter [Burkholderia sp. ISTR5]NIE85637.1 HlyC/CorC family transporter [Burkholderia sp. Tr-860]NIF64099.1 HlyC/CorC family transporter [Burkholderia sp. Cy-647]NIF72705.1 HlyC/CorC family transporter [Burkholderia sp. Ap-962]NIF92474.1 HlyC/CorC family transporter [Burkholderia sp. Cy-637]NIF99478.1 HlyC/CorC family transporter [Burkholderia sp. Ax-1720]